MEDTRQGSIGRTWGLRYRTFWRERAKPWWRERRWLVIGILWLVALVLGYIGFAKHCAALGQRPSATDLLYLTIQLPMLQSGLVEGPMPWELEVARWLAPVVAAYTALAALTTLFYERVQLIRARFLRDHIVICGAGRKGFRLAKSFRERGDDVVIVERYENNDLLEQCQAYGAIALTDDARDAALLRQAAAHRARVLIAVCGDDGVNAEIAMRTQDLAVERKRGMLTCIIHIVDTQLWGLLREREIGAEESPAFRLQLFNVFDRGSRLLLQEFPAFGADQQDPACPPHMLVLGLGRMGESLVVRAARDWWDKRPSIGQRLLVTIIDRDAASKSESLSVRYPRLAEACDLVPCQMDVRSASFQQADFLYNTGGVCDVGVIYICLDDDSLGLNAGLTLQQRMRELKIPIVVRMSENAGLATLLRDGGNGEATSQNLHAFGLFDHTCTVDLMLGGTHEFLARLVHEEYVLHQEQMGQTPGTNPLLVPWDSLPENKRESNRRQVDHMGVKLKAIGCGITRLTDWEAASFEFSPEQVDLMARLEHERWYEELVLEGWTYDPGAKNSDKKTNPDLVPWQGLPEPEKEKNRDTVRELPVFLSRAGFQIYCQPQVGDGTRTS